MKLGFCQRMWLPGLGLLLGVWCGGGGVLRAQVSGEGQNLEWLGRLHNHQAAYWLHRPIDPALARVLGTVNPDDPAHRHTLYHTFGLAPSTIHALESVFTDADQPDDAPLAEVQARWLEWQSELAVPVPPSEAPLVHGVYAIARHSLEFWHSQQDTPIRKMPHGLSDTTVNHSARPMKVPFRKWARADAFGLLKGLVLGTLAYGGLVYGRSTDAAGVAAGAALLLNIPAIESVIYVRKYRRNELPDETPIPDEQREIDPSKL